MNVVNFSRDTSIILAIGIYDLKEKLHMMNCLDIV